MEWTFEDNKQLRQLRSAEDIKSAVLEVMDETIDYFILTPSEPIRNCAFMQAARHAEDLIHLEVCIVKTKGVNSIYYQNCSPNLAIILLQLFYTEGGVPDVSSWMFEGEYQED